MKKPLKTYSRLNNNNISKHSLMKSLSKQNIKKKEINLYSNQEKQLIITNANNSGKKKKIAIFYKKIDYSYVKPKVETGLNEIILKRLLNNNKKKLSRNQTNRKIETEKKTEKKQSLIKRCKITMNKTLENFKAIASNIKKKLFKEEIKKKKY